MGADVVEIIACDELSSEGLVGIAETVGGLLTHRGPVEARLIPQPSCRTAIGDARIVFKVEALLSGVVTYGRRGETMEAVDDKYRLRSLRGVIARYHLARETLATLVDGSHTEGELTARSDGDLHTAMTTAFDILPIVETSSACGGIDDIS